MSVKKQTAMHCVCLAISKTIMTTKTAIDTGEEEFFVDTNNYIVSIQHKINVHLNKEINHHYCWMLVVLSEVYTLLKQKLDLLCG